MILLIISSLFIRFFFLKLGIRSKNRLIRGDQSHRPLVGAPFKARASSVWTLPTENAAEGIKPETFGGANSKIPSQPQMDSLFIRLFQ